MSESNSNFYPNGWIHLIYQDTSGSGKQLYLGADPENPNEIPYISHTIKKASSGMMDAGVITKKLPYITISADRSAMIEPSKSNLAIALRLCNAGLFKIANGGVFEDKIPAKFKQVIAGQEEVELEDVGDIVSRYSKESAKVETAPIVDDEAFVLKFIKDTIEEEDADVNKWSMSSLRSVAAKLELSCSGTGKSDFAPFIEEALAVKGIELKQKEG